MGEKIVEEGAPPLEKRSMVSEEDLESRIEKLQQNTDELSARDTLMLFAVEKLHDISVELKRIADAFEGTKKGMANIPETTNEVGVPLEKTATKVPVAPEIPSQVETTKPAYSRVDEVVKAFEAISGLVRIDTEESAQFVKVYMSGYLGKNDFAKVGKVARGLGGTYVSQGKDSHFTIPKMAEQTKLGKQEERKPQATGDPVEDTKMLFPAALAGLLKFEVKEGFVEIRPLQFLGSENFAKIASIIRGIGGDYVSAGKESHFRVPIKK